jgi:hypothetical protein
MIIRRIIFALSLLGSVFFYILYYPWISWYILVLFLLLVPFDLIISLPGMLTKSIMLSVPPVLEKGASGVLKITTIHLKSYPVRCIKIRLHVAGDDFAAKCRVRCEAERDSRSEVIVDTSRSGLTVFEVKRLWTISLLGLFSLPLNPGGRVTVLVLPPPVKPANTVALPRGILLRPKPGGGFSEEHDMRTYRPGDPVRSIHWKISAKFDSLIIREPLVPPPHSRLVRIMPWENAAECDLTLGRLRWVSGYLLKWELPFYVQLGNDGQIAEIKQESELTDYLRSVLDAAADKPAAPGYVPARFSWVFRVDAKTDIRTVAAVSKTGEEEVVL